MNGHWFVRFVLVVLLIAVMGGFAFYAYNVGIAQGLAQGGTSTAPAVGVAPLQYYGRSFFFHPFGFLGCLFPLFFLFLFFGLMRGIFWGGRRGWMHHRHDMGEKDAPPMFEEWHRKMHERQAQTGSKDA
ncbi:MAG: hypothetical protein HY327_07480 [Chloroflexi bacterium]|nr:hypothetical protein [Chloroflexota bacterium]